MTSLPLEGEIRDVEILDPHTPVVAEERPEMLADQRLIDGHDAAEAAEHLQQPGAAASGRAEDPDDTGLERDARPDPSAGKAKLDPSAGGGGRAPSPRAPAPQHVRRPGWGAG